MKQCETCGATFKPSNGNQIRCKDSECQRKYWREKSRRQHAAKTSHLWSGITCVDCKERFDAERKQARRPRRCPECADLLRSEGPMPRWKVISCLTCTRDFLLAGRTRTYCSDQCKELAQEIAGRKRQRQRVLRGLCPRHGEPGQCEICQGWNFTKSSKRRGRPGESYVSRSKVRMRQLCEQQKWKCALCGKRLSAKHKSPHPLSRSIDHVIPVSLGGTNDLANLQVVHRVCNGKKGNRSLGPEQLRLLT